MYTTFLILDHYPEMKLYHFGGTWKPTLAVGVSGETLTKGAHNKSINKTVVWGYSVVTGMRCT